MNYLLGLLIVTLVSKLEALFFPLLLSSINGYIHTDLSYVITKKQAIEMTIYDAVDLAAGKYSKELERHYTKLFERVTSKCIVI